MIAAFDLSLTQPGWATATSSGIRSGANVTPKAWGIGGRRLSMLRADLLATIVEPCELVVIEDIPMHAKSAGLTAQLHGVMKAAIVDADAGEPAGEAAEQVRAKIARNSAPRRQGNAGQS